MPNVFQNNKAPMSLERVKLFCLFVSCSYPSMEATVLCCFRWSSMPKVLWNNKSPISLERVEWFGRFFACSYLHFVRNLWSFKNMLFWIGIVSYRLSANQIVRCFKLKKTLVFFASIEATQNLMLFWVMTWKHSWPIIL